jgi:glycosyltransferase involved in cell wall biosynthesis
MSQVALRGALWICDYFPRPHDMTTGTWALESVVAIAQAGLPVSVLAPTPWIPKPLAANRVLREWAEVPPYAELRSVPVYYSRMPHYPRKWVHDRLYNRLPVLDTALLWPWCARAAGRIMAAHPFDAVHANFLFPSGYIGLKLKERYGTPLVVQERSVQRLAMARANKARARAYRRILQAADVVITQNESMAASLRDFEPGIADLRVVKQPGAHPDRVASLRRPRPAAFAGKQVVLSVGTLSVRKGHEYLVRAVGAVKGEFPDLVCRIIGDGPERKKLEGLIAELGLGGIVELCGKRPHADVLGEMSWCDVFALASWGEADGTVYGEAAQFGTPVIACADEGIAEVVEDGVQGRLVPARDAHALADALRWLLVNPARRAEAGAAARRLAEEKLSYPKLAERLIEMYGRLVT